MADNTMNSLEVVDIQVGKGEEVKAGDQLSVHYTGWVYDSVAESHKGDKFDSSLDRNSPLDITIGVGHVIQGWDQGVVGMRPGGKRKLVIPASMGYGSRGVPGVIPPNATLIFEIELLKIVNG